MEARMEQLDKIKESMSKLDDIAKAKGVYPLKPSITAMHKELVDIDHRMEVIETRTANTQWTHVPMIGSSSKNSSRLKYVETEIVEYLKSQSADRDEKANVSAWEVAREYRDAGNIGSGEQVEALRKQLMGADIKV